MFSENIKKYRVSNKLTQQELADIIGCPVKTVRDWEQNRSQPKEWVQNMILEKLFAHDLPTTEKRLLNSDKDD